MLEKDIQHTTYIRIILRNGVVFIKCDGCEKTVQASKTVETRVVVAKTLITVGGARIPRRGGRFARISSSRRINRNGMQSRKHFCRERGNSDSRKTSCGTDKE